MGAVGKPYPPNLPPCRGKVAWPKAMTDEGASGDGRDGSKPISFSLPEKETVFGIQRKRGSRGGQVAPNRFSAARLYAPIEVRPRPQWTTWAEQGQAVVLSHLFSPPAWAGDAAWFGAPSRRAPQIAWRHIGTTGGSYPPESLPLGEGAPVRTLERMRVG